jgi:hypothetical protein
MIITFYSSSLVIIIIIIIISLTEQQLKSTLVHTTLVYMRSLHHSHHHTRDMSSTTNNNRRPNEVFRQQEGGNVDGASDASLFTVIVRRNTRVLILTSRTVYYRRRIPEGGFLTDDILHMENLLGIRFERLVDLLERRSGLDGIVNPEVTFWVMMYETTNRLPPRFIIRHRQQANNAVAATPQLLHQVVPSPDDTCVICLETGGVNQPYQEWSTVEGCDAHHFHTACIRRWGTSCPTCRAPWAAAAATINRSDAVNDE